MDQLSQHLSFLPAWAVGPVIALLTIVIGYFISKIAAALVAGGINRTGLGRKAKTTGGNIGKSLSKAVFWVLWLIFILMGLSQFPLLSNQLGFLNGMMENIFSYLPQLAIGGFVLAVGILLSRVVKEALTSTLEAAQVDNLVSRFGLTGDAEDGTPSTSLSKSSGILAAAVVTITAAATGIFQVSLAQSLNCLTLSLVIFLASSVQRLSSVSLCSSDALFQTSQKAHFLH